MKKAKDLIGLPVIAILEGKEVGRVKDTVIDPKNRAIAGLLAEELDWPRGIKVIALSSVRGIGDDAIIIDRQNQMGDLAAAQELEHLLKEPIQTANIKVLTAEGKSLGNVSDFLIDLETGKIAIFEVGGAEKSTLISAERALTMGKELLIVSEGEKTKAFTQWIGAGAEKKIAANLKRGNSKSHLSAVIPSAEAEPTAVETRRVRADPAKTEPLQETEAAPKEKGVRQILEERQDAFLVGKAINKDIVADDGAIIIREGDTISPEIIQKAKEADKYLALTFAIRRN